MQRAIKQTLLTCTCRRSASRPFSLNPARSFVASVHRLDDHPVAVALPWFVDPSTAPPPSASFHPAPQALSLEPPEPPASLPSSLHRLHAHLSISPFLQQDSVTFINAREADPNTWVDYVVIATLKKSREGGLRGAVEGVRAFLTANPVDMTPSPPPTPFAPPSSRPLVTGLPTPPSRHARSRKPSPSRAEQASGWGMVDSGSVVVHIQTEEARATWGLEALWEGIKRENARQTLVEV